MSAEVTDATGRVHPSHRRSLHWHIMLTHFPVSAAGGALLFMGLHIVTAMQCYVLAAYVCLIVAALVITPTALTGWLTWKRRYQGSRTQLFLVKIWAAVIMVPVSLALVAYQTAHSFTRLDVSHDLGHAVYLAGIVILLVGSVVEGYWGGRLHHR